MSEKSARNSLKVRGATPPCELIFKEIWKRKNFRGEASVLHGRAGRGLALAALAAFAVMDTARAEDTVGITVPAGETATFNGETIVSSEANGSAVTLQDGAKLEAVGSSFEGYNGITLGRGNTLTMNGGSITGSRYAIDDSSKTSGATITLDGVTLEGGERAVQLGQAKLNLSNCTVSTSAANGNSLGLTVYDKTNVTLSNTTVVSQWYGVYSRSGSTVALCDNSAISARSYGLLLYEGGSMSMVDGTSISTTGKDGAGIFLQIYSTSSKEYDKQTYSPTGKTPEYRLFVNIMGGSILSAGVGIQGYGHHHGTDIRISGGLIDAADVGLYLPQYGKLTISGGTIIGGNTGIESRAGEILITGGIIMSEAPAFSYVQDSKGSTINGAALAVSQVITGSELAVQGISVKIEGGTFIGPYALYEEALHSLTASDITMSVSGGNFYGKIYSENCTNFITGGNFNDATALKYLGENASVNVKLASSSVAPEGDKDALGNISIDRNSTVNLDMNGQQITANVTIEEGSTLNLTSLGDILPALTISSQRSRMLRNAQANVINGALVVQSGGVLNLDTAITVDSVTLQAGSTTNINGAIASTTTPAISVTGTGSSIASAGEKPTINITHINAKAGEVVQIFDNEELSKQLTNVTLTCNNVLQQIETKENANGIVGVTFEAKDASEVLPDAELGDIVTEATKNNTGNSFLTSALTSGNAQTVTKALNSVANMGEMAAVNRGASTMMGVMTDALADHLSLAHGTEREYGKGVWANFISHNENVRGMQLAGLTADYDARYNGLVFGSDLWSGKKTTLGVGLTYAQGDIDSVGGHLLTRNDAEYYGIGLYGRSDKRFCSFLYDLGYMRGDNDITQYNSGHVVTATPHSNSISAGVKAEKAVKTCAGTFLPYVGLRYMSVNTEDYGNNVGMRYDVDSQNIWTLPVGVAYSYEKQVSSWKLRAIADLGYVWAMGDTEADQSVRLGSGVDHFSYDTMDEGSFVGRLRLEAEKGKTTIGAGYEYRKGDSVSADRWSIYVNRAF